MTLIEANLIEALRIGGAVTVAVGALILLALVARRDRREADTEPDARLTLDPVLDQTQVLPVYGRHRAGRRRCSAKPAVRHPSPRLVSTVYRSDRGGDGNV